MSQLFRIFLKDVRYLRAALGLYFCILALFAVTESRFASSIHFDEFDFFEPQERLVTTLVHPGIWILVFFSAAILISKAVHAEAIPGDKQFWLTRPYCTSSLLGAKIAFVFIGVSLPFFIARLLTLKLEGFNLFPSFWQLLWEQLVFTCFLGAMVTAISALTSELIPFLISTLLLTPALIFSLQDIELFRPWPERTVWVRAWMIIAILSFIAMASVLVQYRTRRSFMVRALTIGVLAFCLLIYTLLPPSIGQAVNAWTGEPMSSTSSPSIQIGPAIQLSTLSGDSVLVTIPVQIGNVPDAWIPNLDQLSVTFRARNASEVVDVGLPFHQSEYALKYLETGSISRKFFESESGAPVDVQVSADVLLYPPETSQTIQISNTFQAMPGNIVCKMVLPILLPERYREGQVVCRSAPGSLQVIRVYPFITEYLRFRPASIPSKFPYRGSPEYLYSPLPVISGDSGVTFAMDMYPRLQAGVATSGVSGAAVHIQNPPRRFHREVQFRNVILQNVMTLNEH
jgi:hypothetical protein